VTLSSVIRLLILSLLGVVTFFPGNAQATYVGPIFDAHSHLPSLQVLDSYVRAMEKHNVTKVLFLGVGGVQKQDVEWIEAAAKRYPEKVLQGAPVPNPSHPDQARTLDVLLGTGRYRAVGEVHVRQLSRKIDVRPDSDVFGRLLEVAAKHKTPVIIHAELNDKATAGLERALKSHLKTTVILAHGGSADPRQIETLLRHLPNLMVDLSGMHFMRTPALATENGPLDPRWKVVMETLPDRFLIGIDAWAPRLFEPATLDRLMAWTRRILGELKPEVAEMVAYKNAAKLFKVE
jgi:Tat protein secretion system quality control protein TatD with DNase activity